MMVPFDWWFVGTKKPDPCGAGLIVGFDGCGLLAFAAGGGLLGLHDPPSFRVLEGAGENLINESGYRNAAAFTLMIQGADDVAGDHGRIVERSPHD
jgi:hypothetical protein